MAVLHYGMLGSVLIFLEQISTFRAREKDSFIKQEVAEGDRG